MKKIKLKDKVQISKRVIKWHVENLNIYFSDTNDNVHSSTLVPVEGWCYHHRTKKPLFGKVVTFGTKDEKGIPFVGVMVKFPGGSRLSFFDRKDLKIIN